MQKEINKYIKHINVAKAKNNHKEVIELYNFVGKLHFDIGSYDEACHYYEQALDVCKTIGDQLGTAMGFRLIGEAKAALGEYNVAINFVKMYLDLAEKLSVEIEIQRAITTLGRIYLMQAQDMKERNGIIDDKTREACREAKEKFQTALAMVDKIRIDIKDKQEQEQERAKMTAGLNLNLGIVADICGHYNEAIFKIKRAAEMYKEIREKRDLFRCQVTLASIYRSHDDIKEAVRMSEWALQTAKSVGDDKVLTCEALIERGLVQICQRDFKNAKRTFAKAYLRKSPNEDDHQKAIRLTKLAHLIATAYSQISKDKTPGETRYKLCEKLGDLFISIENYKLAIEFYRRAYADAKVCGKPKAELARLVFSIAETLADDGQYKNALIFYEKELKYRSGQTLEEAKTLLKIAHMYEYMDREIDQVCEAYESALNKAGSEISLKHNVLKDYVPYLERSHINVSKCKSLKATLENLKSYSEINEDSSQGMVEAANELEDEIANIDDIITDDEDNDEVTVIGRRKPNCRTKFKPNEVGDTPLHEACIKGDLKRVKSLINQGHEVNPRDNAGWIPIHEASNHGHYQIVDFLIEHGADINNRGLKGMSPLHDAATNGHFEIMRLLIKNGANVIALTDSGETVLGCLRDYKKRNYQNMSNSDLSEYKQMEAELLNVMDKCGYNLMNENMKNLGSRNDKADVILVEEVTPRPRNVLSGIEGPVPEPVKEYRHTIQTLKRKRLSNEGTSSRAKKINQPATYQTSLSTSVPTKEWLIDDVSQMKQIVDRRSKPSKEVILESDDEFSDDDFEIPPGTLEKQKKRLTSPQPSVNDNTPTIDAISTEDVERLPSFTYDNVSNHSSTNFSSSRITTSKSSDIVSKPLVITIENRRLLIPITNESTIGQLKKNVAARYSVLVGAEPKVTITPKSDPTCVLFDDDLCRNVLNEHELIAEIESWPLSSIEENYVKSCEEESVESLDYIRVELRSMHTRLDLSYARLPKAHVKPVICGLKRRDFESAILDGATILFECNKIANEVLDMVMTWRKMTHLSLSCVGMTRLQFETLCQSKSSLINMRSVNLSFNLIVYSDKEDFVSHLETLRTQVCPNLLILDATKNDLKFAESSTQVFRLGEAPRLLEVKI